MKNWSIGYEIIRTYVRFAFWLTHKRIVVTGRKLIPKGEPIIFAPNHQNALMDPLAVACTNPHQSLWLARADIFKSKAAKSFLNYIKMLPVYRIRDGKDNLSNNEQIFAQVTEVLENRQTVALFPEAAHSGRRQMLQHRKAIPRIALDAEAKNNFSLGLKILPVGIFYSHYWHFNRKLIVQYGEPIEVDKYREEYVDNPQKAMLSLRDEIYEKLCPLTLQINSETYYQNYEDFRKLAGEPFSKSHFFNKNPDLQLLMAERELIDKIEHIESNHPDYFGKLIDDSTSYFTAIEKDGFTDDLIRTAGEARWPLLIVRLTAAFLALPVFIFGFVFNAVPLLLPQKVLRLKVKDITFLSTFIFATGLIIFPLFYLFAASLIFILTGSFPITLITFILMPFGGKIAYQWLVFYRVILLEAKFLCGSKPQRRAIEKLLIQRNTLIKAILERANF